MKTRSITESVLIDRPPEEVFDALIRPSMIVRWWSASRAIVIPKSGGTYAVSWGPEDEPDYISASELGRFEPPRELSLVRTKYHSKHEALPFEAEMDAHFSLHSDDGGTRLEVVQTGFPADPLADDFYRGCVQGWRDTLAGIKQTLEG